MINAKLKNLSKREKRMGNQSHVIKQRFFIHSECLSGPRASSIPRLSIRGLKTWMSIRRRMSTYCGDRICFAAVRIADSRGYERAPKERLVAPTVPDASLPPK